MKVLILSITAGQGHHATGKAMSDYMQEQGVECLTIDTYEYLAPFLKEALGRGYLINVSYTPELYGKFYRVIENKNNMRVKAPFSPLKIMNRKFAKGLESLITEYMPDVIICTHVLSSLIISLMKEKGRLKNVIGVGIVTDFTMHPFWEDAPALDYYVTANEYMEYRLTNDGLDKEKMLPFGIPIHPKFSQRMDQKQARTMLGIDPNKKTVLLMGGSMGHGNMDQVIKDLDQLDFDFQMLVVCGKNRSMYLKVCEVRTNKTVYAFEYVDNVEVFMDASECIITKPGGLTSSEALAKGLPMIMVNPIPGQEDRNVEFLLNSGLALLATETFPVQEAVYFLLQNEQRISLLRQSIEVFGKKNSAKILGDFLMERVKKQQVI